MVGPRIRGSSLSIAWVASMACGGVALDEDLDGTFPCDVDDDCPPEAACVADLCWRQSPPSVEIVSPEEELVVAYPGSAGTMSLPISLRGAGLELEGDVADADVRYGRGYLEILVDDVPTATVTVGELAATITLAIELTPSPGGHRLEAVATFSDGTPYDNPTATARRFFWVDDGLPHVAIKRPFTGDRFVAAGQEVAVELATLNFSLAPPNPTTTQPGSGHVHFYYDQEFPDCVFDAACDAGFIAVAAPQEGAVPSLSTVVPLPAATPGVGRLTAVLRRLDHSPYLDPNGYPIWGNIVVLRSADEAG